ncbi:MXAN_6230/SCO0854 family RING domain-containing protein [Pseudoduganella violaceinigra]|uniref:MXAN_6230/SCO0854 family RING domain-containing protein n=1 Tax=Pseudoduganella violaceinigra TaxID=246602 RepID=UPI0005597E22|nr:MXAN_6230/SCO0854 family RING domain-containing protein [Pseudoduganella violaceinigra]
MTITSSQAILLRRKGLLFIDAGLDTLPGNFLDAFEINLSAIGYAVSARLRAQLGRLSTASLTILQAQVWEFLAEKVGGNQQHVPLYRRFPEDVPSNTDEVFLKRVLTHFMQEAGQPCLHCSKVGTTHVLNPCRHVVCDACFDGSNHSACPICEAHTDQDSRFFAPVLERGTPNEKVRFKLLDLGEDFDQSLRSLFVSLCQRAQVMSPDDVGDLRTIVHERGLGVLGWLPPSIPVRENVAHVFGCLLQSFAPEVVMQAARQYMNTATDALRLIAAYSGADVGLLPQMIYRLRPVAELREIKRYSHWLQPGSYWNSRESISLPVQVNRFKVGVLKRSMRRAILAFLEQLHPSALNDDLLRHRAFWVWVGEFLHPGEYRKRFPNVAHAFEIIRKKAPDGTRPAAWKTYYGKLEQAIQDKDTASLTALLMQRPGELARRFDHALRVAGDDIVAIETLVAGFEQCAGKFSTPVLLTLMASLPTRNAKLQSRVYWPKGATINGIFASDKRATLSDATIRRCLIVIERELLARFASKPRVDDFLVDEALRTIIVPFNERSASKAAIQLPRGSVIDVEPKKIVRLFLHWCQPENGQRTDLDLSIGFYDESWKYVGTCSYYQRVLQGANGVIATSAGDLTSAPFPDGASEFIDLDSEAAQRHGIRYAVAVINNFSGMAFEALDRAFAGIMLRDDAGGSHFDPRTVELKFDLQGANGIFMPLVLDLHEKKLHWIDVYSKGLLEFNNVATSDSSIAQICPAMINYFASGVRATMYELALLHAAARADRVVIAGDGYAVIERGAEEGSADFLARLRKGGGDRTSTLPGLSDESAIAAIVDGDINLPEKCSAYVLKPGKSNGNISASDFLS